ncbi:hypothetical protein [Streptacidiphilus rugosus]|uniref:hypothetical protein n=1 Tax=Streptacidiphilus rugosus TaxID=405783 RepID=UPI000565CDD4|nr:hypothetical protein [Streptacidiphilus rugosus]
MGRPLALLAALGIFLAGVWAVATTPWTVAVATTSVDALPVAVPPTPRPSATAPVTPAAWTRSTLRDHLVAELDATDPGRALAELERITVSQPQVNDFCHPVAHDLGHAALEKYHGSVTQALNYSNDVCGSGYLHGIMEEKLAQSADPERDVTRLCGPSPTGSCLHGIGHGAMFVSHLDVAKAEQLCDRFGDRGQIGSCAEGIFMQLFEPDEDDPTALAKLPAAQLAAEPLYPCPEQPSVFRSACYFYAPIYFLQTHDYVHHQEAFGQSLRWCLGAPDQDGRDSCTKGTGSRIMKYNLERPVWDAAQCMAAPRDGQRQICVAGLVSYWNVNYHDTSARTRLCPQLAGEARDLCRTAAPGSGTAD